MADLSVGSLEERATTERRKVTGPPRESKLPPVAERAWTILKPTGSRRPWTSASATRDLLWESAAREVKGRYKQNVGKGVWMLVQPITMCLIYSFVFTQIFKASGHGLPYLVMAWTGIILWQFFQHGVQMGMQSLLFESYTLSKVWFPRVVVPLTPGTSAWVDLGVGVIVMFVAAIIQGVQIQITAIAAVFPIAMLAIWMYAFAVLLAPIAVFFRDITTIVPLILRLGFFATPVMYSAAEIPPQYSWLKLGNPVAVAINNVRNCVLSGLWPSWKPILLHTVLGLCALGIALWYLRRVEDRLVDSL